MVQNAMPRFDFNGFVEGKLCMSYKNLFSSEAPLLKGKNLCQFLDQMDQEEYQIITQENIALMAEQETHRIETENTQFYWRIGKYALIGLGIVTFLGSLYYRWKTQSERTKWDSVAQFRRENSQLSPDEYKTRRDQLFDTSDGGSNQILYSNREEDLRYASAYLAAPGLGCALGESLAGAGYGSKDTQFYKERELRILDKIRRIELRTKATQDEAELIQLGQAQDHFNRFKPINPDNVIHHEHQTNHVHTHYRY
jgi:hypothetical protein